MLQRLAPPLLAVAALAAAGPAFPAPPPTAVAPERTWELAGNLRLAAGHKHNVLLSAVQPQESALAQLEGELFWTHTPSERLELVAFSNATVTRFLASAENPHELQAFAHGEARWQAAVPLQVSATLEGYHLKQVFDFSVNHVDRRTELIALTGGSAATTWRWTFAPHTSLAFKPAVQRERFRDRSDDHRQHLGRVTLARTLLAGRLELSVSAQALRRDYDTRPQYTVAGRRLNGTQLFFDQREGEARARFTWGESSQWTAATSATRTTNRDNGSGFFDYRHRALRQEIGWQRAAWKTRLTGRAGRYDYDVQTQGIGVNPPFRLKEEFALQARVERTLTPRTTAFAQLLWERSRSNDPLANYRVKTAFAGLDFSL